MLTFTLTISCLTTSNLPWFMDLTFQIPINSFTSSDLTFTTRHTHNWVLFMLWPSCFILGAVSNVSSLFTSSILDTFQPGGLIFRCHIFFLFILFLRFSRQECWSGLPFPPPVDHDLSEWSYDHLSWVALQSMVHSFIELHNPFSMTRLWSMQVNSFCKR